MLKVMLNVTKAFSFSQKKYSLGSKNSIGRNVKKYLLVLLKRNE